MSELQRLLADPGGTFLRHHTQDLVGLIDPAGQVLEANDRLAGIVAEGSPAAFGDLLPEPDRPRFQQVLGDAASGPDPVRATFPIDPDQAGRPASHTCWIVRASADRLLLIAEPTSPAESAGPAGDTDLVAASRELRQVRDDLAATRQALDAAIAQIEQLAHTDALTGLATHRIVLTRLEAEIARAARHVRPLSILLIDLDRFKYINDAHGHLVGDAVLRQTAVTLNDAIRRSDTLGRYGGEEFLAVLPETDAAAARLLAERLRRHVEAAHYAVAGTTALSLTVSVGVATFEPDGDTLEALVARADQALHDAKSAGRNRVISTSRRQAR